MTTLIADIETDGFLHQMTLCHCLAIKDTTEDAVTIYADHEGYRPISEGLSRLSGADCVVFHNGIGFDIPAIVRLYGTGILDYSKVFDTLVGSRLKDSTRRGHSIKDYGRELGEEKLDYSDFTKFTDEMAEYCKVDVKITQYVYDKTKSVKDSDAYKLEADFVRVLQLQEEHGFRLDLDKANDLCSELRQEISNLEEELQDLWPSKIIERWSEKTGKRLKDKVEVFNPGSRKMIAERLAETHGWKPKSFTPSGGPKIDEVVLSNLPYPEAKQLARYFRVQKQLGQLSDGDNGWLKLVRGDRVHGGVSSMGTATHRCSHFKPNMAQVDKKDLRMREVWVADEGQVLVGCDADALELVCLAHYLGKYDNGVYRDALLYGSKEEGTDVHSRTQKLVELPTRDEAKRMQYAYLYGASDRKLASISKEAGGPLKDGKEIRKRMDEGIDGLGELSEGIQKRAKAGWFKAIDGRKITIRSPHSALNFLLQSCGAIVMKKAAQVFHYDLAVKKQLVVDGQLKGFAYVANVHDEVQFSADPDVADVVGQAFADSITEAAVRLGMRCPLSGTYEIGANWKETH
jgi:DNA polymerase-1